ncbi:VOC family protein [Arsenicicoccus dermatophilus]|uniref:VOC family protein n=1 Tax=Arsenicicoccus dermatophilus TaxID=1076331 RepID=UPI001F4D1F68|nr:VOC family protein [Arsenicicoccus dermatophilus]MCH8611700.1 VOC family protein [Arsenicicoccus dermatophilus]
MTTNRLSPYVAFDGNAAEALEFWHSVLGGDLRITRFGDLQVPGMPAEGVMHGQLDTEAGWTIMAADSTRPGDEVVRGGTSLCLWGRDEATLRSWFDGLAEGGTVHQPLEKQVWGDVYGDLTDRFGVTWSVNIGSEQD